MNQSKPDIRQMRTALGLSQSQLARALRVSKRTICRWEAGSHAMHPVYLMRMMKMVDDATVAAIAKEQATHVG